MAAREPEVVEYLIEEGAKTNLRDSGGRTPLARARENRDAKTVKLLLSYRSQSGRRIVGGDRQGGKTPLLVFHMPVSFSSFSKPPSNEDTEVD